MGPKTAGYTIGENMGHEASTIKGKATVPSTSLATADTTTGQGLSDAGSAIPQKKKKRTGQKKRRRQRRPSFLSTQSDENEAPDSHAERPSLEDVPERQQSSFYRLGNVSGDSLESEALLDHR